MISLDAQWDFSLTRHSPGTNLNFTFDDFNNNLVNITKEMSGALKPWVESRANAIAAELGFTIPAGTADRVTPPPRDSGKGKGKGKGGSNSSNGDGNGNSAASLSVSGFAFIAMLASCLMMLA
ncbi:hypothetical protein BGZ80_001424 [Entomortierella chlamydospora]|uniref:Uncharacterized protein n=1 Tax=Entomortierella chlamydospora TaxID=101097 RepID=A0A9P6MRJ2_9FUNG|nr:hypothetical protein BGZ80_001424 [Entomortierella chlamydospora]